MVKRFCIFYSKLNGDLSVYISPGFGIVLFNTEEDVIKYLENNKIAKFMIVSPVFTFEEFADTQTINL